MEPQDCGWRIEDEECADLASGLLKAALKDEHHAGKDLVVHADNGGTQPSRAVAEPALMRVGDGTHRDGTMTIHAARARRMEAPTTTPADDDEGRDDEGDDGETGIISSFSRPRVSDDNPFSEALFRTAKYWIEYPRMPFASLDEARTWVAKFVAWYNNVHLHSGIAFVTPADRHARRDTAILSARRRVYERARRRHPERWANSTRTWEPPSVVRLNPDPETEAPATAARRIIRHLR